MTLQTETIGGLEVKVVPDGHVITEPGLYRMSMAWYHSGDVCAGPSVSSTGLRAIQNISPRAFWKTWAGNPDRYPEKDDSDALNLGRAVHSLILGDEVFEDHFVWVPDDAPRRPTATQIKAFERDGKWSELAKPGAEFWKEFDKKAEGRTLLTPDQFERITYMAESLADNPQCVDLLRSDLVEISMIWRDEATGIWVKSRPDCIPTNGADFSDLKTFSPKGRDIGLAALRSVTDFAYPMQMALASMGSQELLGLSGDRCALVFLQTTKPFECVPVEIDTDSLYWAKVECRAALDTMARCLEANDWPGLGATMRRYEYPPSKLARFSDLQAAGELPNI
jgi:hypothetical protein